MIYILQCERTRSLKIGYSADPKSRIKTLRTGSPDRLRFVGLIEGDRGVERQVHRDLQKHRLAGEWFAATAEVVAYLEDLLGKRSGSRPFCRALVAEGPGRP